MDKGRWKRKVNGMIWALHGAVGMADDWKVFSSHMAEHGHMTRRVDLWRFLSCCPMSLREFGQALNEEVRRVDENPVLLGYSMGARLALHALLDDPELWEGSVLVAPHIGLAEEERPARQVKDAEWATKALSRDWGGFLDEWNSQDVLSNKSTESSELGLGDRRMLGPRRQQVARSFMDWSTGVQDDLRVELKRIASPVLWVVGDEDEKFKAIGQEGVNLLPRAELSCVEGSGHRVPWEQPKVFANKVASWITKIQSGE